MRDVYEWLDLAILAPVDETPEPSKHPVSIQYLRSLMIRLLRRKVTAMELSELLQVHFGVLHLSAVNLVDYERLAGILERRLGIWGRLS